MPTIRSRGLVPYIDIPTPRCSTHANPDTAPTVAQHPPKTVLKKVKRKLPAVNASRKTAPQTQAAPSAQEREDGDVGADGEESGNEDDEDSSSEVERMLTSPGKTQDAKRKAPERTVRRDMTAVSETENEGEGAAFQELRRGKRAVRTYSRKASTAKGKEKAIGPQEEPEEKEAEEEVEEEDEEDQLDSDNAAPPAAQKENVPPSIAAPSKRDASGSQKKRKPPRKKRVAAPRRRQPSQTPRTSDADYSPSQRRAFDGLDDSDDDGQPTPLQKELQKELEQGFSNPPRIFQHRSGTGWRADNIWLHSEWKKAGKRDKVAKFITDHGGKVMPDIEGANFAILPPYDEDCYAKLYEEAISNGTTPIAYLWLKDCSERSFSDDRPTRLDPMKYTASAPAKRDSRWRRYRRLNDAEKDKMVKLYAFVQTGRMGRHEMLERLERLLYDQTGRTKTEYSALLDEYEDEFESLAKRLRPEQQVDTRRGQLFNNDQTDSNASPAHVQPSRKRRRRVSTSRDEIPSLDYSTQSMRLSLAYKRPLPLVDAISLSCSLSVPHTETILAALKEWEMVTLGLPVEEAVAGEAADGLLEETRAICWGPRTDKDIVKGKRSTEDIAETCGKTVEQVEDRREFLEDLGEDDRLGWYPNEAGLKRVLEERMEDDSGEDDDQFQAEEDEEEELFPLPVRPGEST
ncbi:proteophosphoglycan 5 [Rhodotorula toruloides]|uniref:Proteophosphoglycan 5 n=1 Tax=Rhodotorula toruloides TaxID=5286 RepID=A0A511KGZ9_RHOTO|nr:proteophosphoglycan 5 [Rhodotorula toruloides]